MTITSTFTGFHELNDTLKKLEQDGRFSLCLLTDDQGLLIASSGEESHDSEQQSAAVALIRKTIDQAGKILGIAGTEEISLSTIDGRRMICRPFRANGLELILVTTLKAKKQSYRRITSQAIAEINQIVRRSRS